ncbi:MAG: sigma factor, ECF subfamily protein [Opitutus sp.]|nr:sigma factor, ECF subfamily protein [Opitutus sp.]
MVEHFFRHETGRLHGALIRILGVENISLAEDVTQEAMMRALHSWSMGGVPANPSAWITRVAMNLARDTMRHRRMAGGKEQGIITHFEQLRPDTRADEHEIHDDALRLMFGCCHPEIATDAQVVLALKVLCGFSTAEIARAFFSSDAAIDKQLTRTKQRIRDAGIRFEIPEGAELAARLDGVLATLYLLFNEGYKASAGDRLVRVELCLEAVRLLQLLVAHPAGNTPRAHALLALMLLTAARFPARLGEHGDLLRLDGQDRTKWSPPLIDAGLKHLASAAQGTEITEYHLQAGIAAIHCLAPDYASTDWAGILRHYDELARLKSSPIIELNRAVAIAHVHGPRAGLEAVAKIPQRDRLDGHYLLYAVQGELHWRLGDHRAAAENFRRALTLAQVGPEQVHLTRMLERTGS